MSEQATDGYLFQAPTDFCHWFAGFTAGEGCFYARRKTDNNTTWVLDVCFTMRADEKAIIDEIARYTGGKVYEWHSAQHHQVHLRITNRASQYYLYKLFSKHKLRAKKQEDFAIWTELLAAKLIGLQADAIPELIEQLKAIKTYKGPPANGSLPDISSTAIELAPSASTES